MTYNVIILLQIFIMFKLTRIYNFTNTSTNV